MLKEAVAELAASGADLIYSFSFVLLAEVYLTMKRTDESLRALDMVAQRDRANGSSPARSGNSSAARRDDASASERRRRSRAMLQARDRDCRAARGATRGAARGDQPGAAVSEAPAGATRLARRWRRCSRNSPRDSTPAICARRKRCSKNWKSRAPRLEHAAELLTDAAEESGAFDASLGNDRNRRLRLAVEQDREIAD